MYIYFVLALTMAIDNHRLGFARLTGVCMGAVVHEGGSNAQAAAPVA